MQKSNRWLVCGLASDAHSAGQNELTGVCFHGWPPEIVFDEGQGAVNAGVVSEAGLVGPLQHL